MPFRSPTPDELRLLDALATIAGMQNRAEWLRLLKVQELHDGGMGSLELSTRDAPAERPRRAVRRKASVQFTDTDGVEVIASLNADANDVPFELDVWKTDFSQLLRIAARFDRLED
jgi:hypothetical protein